MFNKTPKKDLEKILKNIIKYISLYNKKLDYLNKDLKNKEEQYLNYKFNISNKIKELQKELEILNETKVDILNNLNKYKDKKWKLFS